MLISRRLFQILIPVLSWLVLAAEQLRAEANEVVIDAIVASVDGKPITLQDVSKRLNPPRELNIESAKRDQEVKTVLEGMILEKLIQQEAEAKKLGVSNAEIEEYINEVAARNNMSRAEFEKALKQENKDMVEYKSVLKVDILKSKLTSAYVKGAVSVSEEEIDRHMKGSGAVTADGDKVKLSQILIKFREHTEIEARKIIEQAQAELEEGSSFEEVAAKYSEGAEAKDGGSLGEIGQADLSRDIAEAIAPLDEGEISAITATPAGLHIFKLDERIEEQHNSEEDDETKKENNPEREEIRKQLYNQKMRDKMTSFFTTEIYKLHSVDKKI